MPVSMSLKGETVSDDYSMFVTPYVTDTRQSLNVCSMLGQSRKRIAQ